MSYQSECAKNSAGDDRLYDDLKKVYCRWGSKGSIRAGEVAPHFEAELIKLPWQSQNPLVVPIRYAIQFVQTLWLLFVKRPDLVFTQHTQPFCTLAAALYSWTWGANYVTDCHNGPFQDPVDTCWPLSMLHRWLFRHAALNLVHNRGMLEHVREELDLPGRFEALQDPIPDLPAGEAVEVEHPVVLVINTFSSDEPFDVVYEAAAQTPEVQYYVTGDDRKVADRVKEELPSNVRLTGYMPDERYYGMLREVDAAMALSTRENVLTCASQEAIAAGKAFVTTDCAMAREYLQQAAVLVENRPESVAGGVQKALEERSEREEQMEKRRQELKGNWQIHLKTVKQSIEQNVSQA